MQRVTASRHKLGALSLMILFACKPGPGSQSATAGASGGADSQGCVRDQSHDAATAIPIVGGTASGMICPQADVKWYSLTVPPGADLLSVKAAYPGFTAVHLEMQLCPANPPPASCNSTNGLAGSFLTDTAGGGTSKVASIIKVVPGDYDLTVGGVNADTENVADDFSLTIATDKDQDTNEPNDVLPNAGDPVGQVTPPSASGSYPTGYFAYAGDVDVFHLVTTATDPILEIKLVNGASATTGISATLQDSVGCIVATNTVPAPGPGSAAPSIDVRIPTPSQGCPNSTDDYYLVLTPSKDAPSNANGSGYTLSVTATQDPDVNDQGTTRNDTPDTATPMTFSNATVDPFAHGSTDTFTYNGGYIGTNGDHDVYSLDVASSLDHAAILQVQVTFSADAPPIRVTTPQIDIYTPDPSSPCTTDSDCDGLNQPCEQRSDGRTGEPTPGECEISHVCLPPSAYHFCGGGGAACALCASTGHCVSPGGTGTQKVCAALQYSNSNAFNNSSCGAFQETDCEDPALGGLGNCTWDAALGACIAQSVISQTAQPILQPGRYYVDVHAYQDQASDPNNHYTLTVNVSDETDPGDQPLGFQGVDYNSTTWPAPFAKTSIDVYAEMTTGGGKDDFDHRNNFYYPTPYFDATNGQTSDVTFNQKRAENRAGMDNFLTHVATPPGPGLNGTISYDTDEDWYAFPFPCTPPGSPATTWTPVNTACPLQWTWSMSGSPVSIQTGFLPSIDGFVWDPNPLTPKFQISQNIYTSFGATNFGGTGHFPAAGEDDNCDDCSAAMWDFWNNQDANIANKSPCHDAKTLSACTGMTDLSKGLSCDWKGGPTGAGESCDATAGTASCCHAMPLNQYLQVRDSHETNWNYMYNIQLDSTALGSNVCPKGCQGGKLQYASQLPPPLWPPTTIVSGKNPAGDCGVTESCIVGAGQSRTDEVSGTCMGRIVPGSPAGGGAACTTCCQGAGDVGP